MKKIRMLRTKRGSNDGTWKTVFEYLEGKDYKQGEGFGEIGENLREFFFKIKCAKYAPSRKKKPENKMIAVKDEDNKFMGFRLRKKKND